MGTLRTGHGRIILVVGIIAGVCYSNFIVDMVAPPEGIDYFDTVSALEVPGQPRAGILTVMDYIAAGLTLVLVPYLHWALPRGWWARLCVWSTVVFGVFGLVCTAVTLPCVEGTANCPADRGEELQAFWHDFFSIVSTIGLFLSMIGAAMALRRTGPAWMVQGARWTLGVGVGSGAVYAIGYLADADTLVGVVQRSQLLALSAWIICLGVYAATEGVRAVPWGRERVPEPG